MPQELRYQVSSPRFRSPAFTLIELLVVVAIIAILMSIILGVSGHATHQADRARAIADIEKIKNALEEYRIAYGGYPVNATATNNSIGWVADLWVKPQSGSEGRRPFLTTKFLTNRTASAAFLDPWGNDYRYLHASVAPFAVHNNSKFGYDLWSLGPDSRTDADDVTNWKGDF